MANGMDKDWKYNTIFLSQELLQANVDSLEDDSPESDSKVAIPDISTARPGTSQQPFYKSPRLCRSFASTDLLCVHHHDHSRSSLHSLEGALEVHADRTTELPGGEKWNNSKGKEAMDVEDEDTWEGGIECGTQAKEESLGSLCEQEEEDDTSSPARTGAHTTDSDKYKQKECRGVEMESDSVKWKMDMVLRSVQTVQETLRTLLTHLVEAQIFNNHSTRISANPHMPTSTTTSTTTNPPTPAKHPAVTTPAQPAPASLHPVSHPPPHVQPHPHCQAAHAVSRRPSEMCLTQLIHPYLEPHHPDLLAEPPSCGQRRREKAAVFRILTELRGSVELLLSAQRQECEAHMEVLALLREVGPPHGHKQSDWVRTQLHQLHCQASQITELAQQAVSVFCRVGVQLETLGAVDRVAPPGSAPFSTSAVSGSPLLCHRCQAEITQISESEV